MKIRQIGPTGGILSNNWAGNSYVNRHFERPTGEKLTKAQREDSKNIYHYIGAIIGSPKLNDFPSRVKNEGDLDYAAMYPSGIVLNNLSPETIKYKIWIDPKQFTSGMCIYNGIGACNDPDDWQKDYADACIGDFVTGNTLAFMHNWFGTPTIDQVFAWIQRDRVGEM